MRPQTFPVPSEFGDARAQSRSDATFCLGVATSVAIALWLAAGAVLCALTGAACRGLMCGGLVLAGRQQCMCLAVQTCIEGGAHPRLPVPKKAFTWSPLRLLHRRTKPRVPTAIGANSHGRLQQGRPALAASRRPRRTKVTPDLGGGKAICLLDLARQGCSSRL